jgi:GH24 family phage-related lysozyme (muramidase)
MTVAASRFSSIIAAVSFNIGIRCFKHSWWYRSATYGSKSLMRLRCLAEAAKMAFRSVGHTDAL